MRDGEERERNGKEWGKKGQGKGTGSGNTGVKKWGGVEEIFSVIKSAFITIGKLHCNRQFQYM